MTNPAHSMLETLTQALLYEGYSLFPYHRASAKNVKPVPFGVVYPRDYVARHPEVLSEMQTQCLARGRHGGEVRVAVTVRFLHLRARRLRNHSDREVPVLRISDVTYVAGWQAVERQVTPDEVAVASLVGREMVCPIDFQGTRVTELLCNAQREVAGKELSEIAGLTGAVTLTARAVEGPERCFQITVRIANTTPVANPDALSRDEVSGRSLLSTHTLLSVSGGEFVSVLEPDEDWQETAARCRNVGTWPVLVGEDNTRLLSSPIILHDHPQLAPQSTGDLFDSTEIEEALLLHVAALSDDEKERLVHADDRLRAMIERANRVTPEELLNLHGVLHEPGKPGGSPP